MKSLILLPTFGSINTPINVGGSGFPKNVKVNIKFKGLLVGSVITTPTGNFSIQIIVPKTISPGTYNITAVIAGIVVGSAKFTVVVVAKEPDLGSTFGSATSAFAPNGLDSVSDTPK